MPVLPNDPIEGVSVLHAPVAEIDFFTGRHPVHEE